MMELQGWNEGGTVKLIKTRKVSLSVGDDRIVSYLLF